MDTSCPANFLLSYLDMYIFLYLPRTKTYNMKNKFYSMIIISVLIVLAGMTASFTGQPKSTQTAGNMVFTFKTVTDNGTYSPKHVMAVWIEDSNGFVRTQLRQAVARKQYLYTWIAQTGQNEVDATTGATLSSHQTRTITWDCTDLSGNEVPDGVYTVRVEYTDQHAQGPLYSINFTKGATYQHLTPANETYFINLDLEFTPSSVATADFSSNVQSVCTGEEVVFTDNSSLATSYEWDFGDGANPAIANTVGPHTVTYSTSGAKTVSLTVNGSVVQSFANYITVEAKPVAGFNHTIGNNLEVTFTSTATDALVWEWNFGDGNTSNLENPVHIYATEGNYEVQLTAINVDCEDDFSQTINVVNQGIESNGPTRGFSIFPNPGNGIFNIHMNENAIGQPIVNIYDYSGKIVHHQVVSNLISGSFTLNADKLAPGLYFMKIQSGDETTIEKVVVQ